MQVFNSIANFGSKKSIEAARQQLLDQVASGWEIYESLNKGRNPLAGIETYVQFWKRHCSRHIFHPHSLTLFPIICLTNSYIIPVAVAMISAILRWFTDKACSAYVCRATSEVLHHTSLVVLIFLSIVAATKFKQIKDAAARLKRAAQVVFEAPPAKTKHD
jgi:atlastin